MIRYTLTCADGHRFDSWFQSGDAFDSLAARGMLACATCGSTRVDKAPMAPAVATDRRAAGTPPGDAVADIPGAGAPPGAPVTRPLAATDGPVQAALAELRRAVEANSDYVGLSFAAEARAIHDGDAPARAIHGEARPEEARKLIEDGIPVTPLPFLPRRKTN